MIISSLLKELHENLAAFLIFLYLPLGLTVMQTVFNYKQFGKNRDDFKAFLYYFGAFFLFIFVIPVFILILGHVELNTIGFTFGNMRYGIIIVLSSVPLSFIIAAIGSRDPIMKDQYPFSKSACVSLKKFVIFETCYLFLYYFSWEFLFRGLLFFSILSSTNLIIALSIQTIISTLYHIGHPPLEILGAMAAGFFFGIIAFVTGSFFYTILIHALIGISTDSFLYIKYHRGSAGVS
jgi:membrane protease YdiL (CAAX protease family)